MKPISIILVTGYLGAGKTTLVNQLLQNEKIASKHLALIINEFGTVGIDGQLITPGDYSKYEINKGSLFCVCTKLTLMNTLSEIASDGKTELVVVEVTGIATPCDFESVLESEPLSGRFKIDYNICLVDALNYVKVAANLPAASQQVASADGIVINKSDLVPESDLKILTDILIKTNSHAKYVTTSNAVIDTDFLANLTHQRSSSAMAQTPPPELCSITIEHKGIIDRQRFEEALDGFGEKLLRLKGYVTTQQGRFFVETIHGQTTFKPVDNTGKDIFVAILWQQTPENAKSILQQAAT